MSLSDAYKHVFDVVGDVQSRNPGFFSKTPSTLISEGTIYTAALKTRVQAVAGFVSNNNPMPEGSTGRSSHLFAYDSTATSSILAALRGYVDFEHKVETEDSLNHTIRLYVWNDNTSAWEQLDTDTTSGGVRTLQGEVSANLSDYIEVGTDLIYVLLWDFEGIFNPVGGGCAIKGTLVRSPTGSKCIELVEPYVDMAVGVVRGEGIVERRVADTTEHGAAEWGLARISTKDCGSVTITEEHELPTRCGVRMARDIHVGDYIVGMSRWELVTSVELYRDRVAVYDISPHCQNYFVNNGILINRSRAP